MGLETVQSRYLDGRPVMTCGEKTESQIDKEVMKILDECYARAREIIEANVEVMKKLASHLIEKETITGKEFVKIYEETTGIKLKKKNELTEANEETE